MATAIFEWLPSTIPTAGNRSNSRSSSTGHRRSLASTLPVRKAKAASSAIRREPTQRTNPRGSVMADASIMRLEDGGGDIPAAIDLRAEYIESGVKEVLDELDRDLIGL